MLGLGSAKTTIRSQTEISRSNSPAVRARRASNETGEEVVTAGVLVDFGCEDLKEEAMEKQSNHH